MFHNSFLDQFNQLETLDLGQIHKLVPKIDAW
jgi:hypothetical protein